MHSTAFFRASTNRPSRCKVRTFSHQALGILLDQVGGGAGPSGNETLTAWLLVACDGRAAAGDGRATTGDGFAVGQVGAGGLLFAKPLGCGWPVLGKGLAGRLFTCWTSFDGLGALTGIGRIICRLLRIALDQGPRWRRRQLVLAPLGTRRLAISDRAGRLHGPYSLWDLGDRPQKVIADCQTVRAKQRKNKLPPAPSGTLVQSDPKKPADNAPIPVKAPKPSNDVQQVNNRPASPLPSTGQPQPSGLANNSPPAPTWPTANPSPVVALPSPAAALPSHATNSQAVNVSLPEGPARPTADLVKQNAQRLMAEVRTLQSRRPVGRGPKKSRGVQ